MDIIQIILQLVVALGLAYLFSQFKELPNQIHAFSMKEFEHDLSKKLETFKKELTTELEEFKISRSELQIRKSEEFTKFIVSFLTFLSDSKARRDPRAAEKYVKETNELAGRIFLYGSDATIKKYVEYKRFGNSEQALKEPEKALRLLCEVVLEYRRDLGYKDTTCNADDFLSLIVKD
jgi:hypothetical protein